MVSIVLVSIINTVCIKCIEHELKIRKKFIAKVEIDNNDNIRYYLDTTFSANGIY
jgi:hypothetical protein